MSRRHSRDRDSLPRPALPPDLDQRRTIQQQEHCPTLHKLPYPDRGSADRAAAKRAMVAGVPLRGYECRCGWWHLTSQPETERDQRRSATRNNTQEEAS